MYQEYGFDDYVGEGPMIVNGYRAHACLRCGVRPVMFMEDYCAFCIDLEVDDDENDWGCDNV